MDYTMSPRQLVYQYVCEHLDPTDNVTILIDDIYIVWFCYIIGGWKALVSTNLPDGMYYEVTFNKDNGESYIDAYKRFDHRVIPKS